MGNPRVSVIANNGRRLKLVPAEVHRLLVNDWARIPEDDPTSQETYNAWLEDHPTEATEIAARRGKRPPLEFPEGYRWARRGQWIYVRDPHGDSVGQGGYPNMNAAIDAARQHARLVPQLGSHPVAIADDATDALPQGYAIEEKSGGRYQVYDPTGAKVGGAVTTYDRAFTRAIEHAKAEE